MKILCTAPGKYGDLMWTLPTVKEIYKQSAAKWDISLMDIDVGIMPQYRSILPLLNAQPYIDNAFVIENWICVGSHAGDQPWEAPVPEGYDKVYHLGYRHHPSKNQPLIDFIAGQQGISFAGDNPIPFISVPSFVVDTSEKELLATELLLQRSVPTIAYAFNESMIELKENQLNFFKAQLEPLTIMFKDVSKRPWLEAAHIINNSIAFIGCRSANYVLACGLGKRIFIYEPNISRSQYGMWGTTFTCPYANESEIIHSQTDVEEIKSLAAGVLQ